MLIRGSVQPRPAQFSSRVTHRLPPPRGKVQATHDKATQEVQRVKIVDNGFSSLKHRCLEALQIVAQKGYRLPDEIHLDSTNFEDLPDSVYGQFKTQGRGFEAPALSIVYLNPAAEWNHGPLSGSTTHHLHPIIHELGHAAHYLENPNFFILENKSPPPEEISYKVSEYAGKSHSSKEFVAEAFAKKVLGEGIEHEVAIYYHKFGGPISQMESPLGFERPNRRETNWGDEYY